MDPRNWDRWTWAVIVLLALATAPPADLADPYRLAGFYSALALFLLLAGAGIERFRAWLPRRAGPPDPEEDV